MSGFKLVGATASATHRVNKNNLDDADILALSANVIEATASLEKVASDAEKAAVLATNITAGLNAAEHIKNVTGDENAALVTAMASATISMSSVGMSKQDIDGLLDPSSYSAATASATDVIKDAWETAKEYGKKVWEYIRNLLNSLIDFVMGIIGKGGESGKKLLDMLDKLKKDGKIRLNTDEFNEGVQKRIAKRLPYIVGKASAKLGSGDYKSFIESVFSAIGTTNTDNNEAYTLENGVAADKTTTGNTDFKYVGKYANGKDDKKHIIGMLEKFGNDHIGDKSGDTTTDKDDAVDTDDIEAEIGDVASYSYEKVGQNAKQISLCVTYVTNDAKDAYQNFKTDKLPNGDAIAEPTKGFSTQEIVKVATAMTKGVKVVDIKVKVKEEDALSNAEYVVPLDFSDARAVADDLKTKAKGVEKKVKELEKKAKNLEKEAQRTYKEAEKTITSTTNDGKARVMRAAFDVIDTQNKITRDKVKAKSAGAAISVAELLNSNVAVVITESARLYEK